MSKEKNMLWCKIYEVEGYQVLVKKESYNHKEEQYSISVSCQTSSGTEISMNFGHEEESEVQILFDGCDEKMVTKFVDEYVKPMDGN